MIHLSGRKRVIITNIAPSVENGRFTAKGLINDSLIFSADIFIDGHDEIAASVFVKHNDETQWNELPMKHINNDHWEAIFHPDKLGVYEFRIEAWVDHFTTWKKGLIKKNTAGQNLDTEILIGAEILESAAKSADKKLKSRLLNWASSFRNSESIDKAITLALGDEISAAMSDWRDEELVTKHPQVYKVEVEREKAGFSTWYELFPRSASAEPDKHGTFNDVKRLLPRVAKMGFDILYFPPIHPIGEKNRKGKNNALTTEPGDPGSPWAIGNRLGGHKAIHPELGTLEDFKSLVAEAKALDIEIAMDIAYQCAPDHPYVTEHPQWFKWRPDGTVQYAENPPKRYEDILPFNFETEDWQNLWQELKSVIDYWIAQGVNVFRIDNPHTKAFHFWEWMIGEVRKENPQVLFLAEAFTRPRIMERLGKGGFTQSYTYFTWRNTKKEIEEYVTELTQTELKHYFRPNFWPNTPDILPPELSSGGENAHIMRLILAATLSSNYGLYGPVYEFCINTPHPKKEEYIDNEKYELKHWNWDEYTRIGEIVTRINRIRKENAALQTTNNILFAKTSSEKIICYVKSAPGNTLIMVVNLDPFNTQTGFVHIPIEELGIDYGQQYVVKDLISGEKYKWHDDWNYVELNPYAMPAHVFRLEKLETHA